MCDAYNLVVPHEPVRPEMEPIISAKATNNQLRFLFFTTDVLSVQRKYRHIPDGLRRCSARARLVRCVAARTRRAANDIGIVDVWIETEAPRLLDASGSFPEEIEEARSFERPLDNGRSCEPRTKIEQRRSIVSLQPLCSDHLYRIVIEIEFQRKLS